MNRITIEKGYEGNEELTITAGKRRFTLSIEQNGRLYIGFCGLQEDKDDVMFTITENDEFLYTCIKEFYLDLTQSRFSNNKLFNLVFSEQKQPDSKPVMNGKVYIRSEDFVVGKCPYCESEVVTSGEFINCKNCGHENIPLGVVRKKRFTDDASYITIEEKGEMFEIIFHRSKSQDKVNSYFISVRTSDSKYEEYSAFFTKLYATLAYNAKEYPNGYVRTREEQINIV